MTTEKHELILPIIHLNGTSRESLIELRTDACHAIRAAYDALKQMAPNGRDYYPAGPTLFEQAIAQHERRLRTLQGLEEELMRDAEAIYDTE